MLKFAKRAGSYIWPWFIYPETERFKFFRMIDYVRLTEYFRNLTWKIWNAQFMVLHAVMRCMLYHTEKGCADIREKETMLKPWYNNNRYDATGYSLNVSFSCTAWKMDYASPNIGCPDAAVESV